MHYRSTPISGRPYLRPNFFFPSNYFAFAFATDLISKYPRIFTNSPPFLILIAVLAIPFPDRLGYVNKIKLKNCFEIGLAHCHSFPCFEMMEFLAINI